MTDDRSIERAARSWLEIGPTEAPERAVEAALLLIDTTPQERDWHVPWRLPKMTTPARVASAAVIGVLVVGGALYTLAPGGSGPGGPGATASPTPSPVPSAAPASPSTAPSAGAVFPSWYTDGGNGAGNLSAGSQTTRSFVPAFTFTVPEGWVNTSDEAGFFGLFPDTPANQDEFGRSDGLAQEIFLGPNDDPYFVCDAWEDNQGATAADIVAAAVANDALATTSVDVTIGGLTGKQIDVRVDPAWTESCPGDPPGFDLGDGRTRTFLLDTPDGGVLMIAVNSMHAADHEAFLAEAMPIVESFQFDMTQ